MSLFERVYGRPPGIVFQPFDWLKTNETHAQLEDLFNVVWACEAEWRFDDRLDLALKQRRA